VSAVSVQNRTGLTAQASPPVQRRLGLALLVIAYQPAVDRFRSDIAFIPLSYDPAFVVSLARDLLLGGALLGALGSYIGVRRYVKL